MGPFLAVRMDRFVDLVAGIILASRLPSVQ
jgi:hypothetical protein